MDASKLVYEQKILHEYVRTIVVREASKIFGCHPSIEFMKGWDSTDGHFVYTQKIGRAGVYKGGPSIYMRVSVVYTENKIKIDSYHQHNEFIIADPQSRHEIEEFIRSRFKRAKKDLQENPKYVINKLGVDNDAK